METILFIASAIALHIPLQILRHTIIKFNRMSDYNPSDAFMYSVENGRFDDSETYILGIVGYVSSLGLALVPLFATIHINWLLLILANALYSFIVAPWVGFIVMPFMKIYSRNQIKRYMFRYLLFGIAFSVWAII